MGIKKWIGIIVMMAFVVTTIPSISHAAMPHNDTSAVAVKSEQSTALAHEGCAGHHDQTQDSQKTAAKKDTSGKPCCDGKTCKCVGNSCNGSTKIFGSNSIHLYSPQFVKAPFSLEERTANADFHIRIKRPPRA